MFIVTVLDYDNDGDQWYVKYSYGPFDKYDSALTWTRNFPDYTAQVSNLIRPTFNAD